MHCPVCETPDSRHFLNADGRRYWRCAQCHATFLEPAQRPTHEAERAEYHLHCNALDDAGYRAFLGRLAAPLLAQLPAASEGLDYGCGPGPALAEMLREAGHSVALYDPIFHPDASAFDRRYDFITCTEVIEHFHHPSREFARLDTLLKPGACLALMTCFQTDDARFARWHYRRDPTHVVFYREATLRFLAGRHGWRCAFPVQNVAILRKAVA